jgi:hypothetical protein
MSLTFMINKLNYLSESLGLPPVVLICIGAPLIFLTPLGLMILTKIRRIRIDLADVNRGLITLNKYVKESSDKTVQPPKIEGNTGNHASNSSDFRKKNVIDTRIEKLNMKTKIINLLKISSRPISYSEIAKNLSNDSADYDFEYILSELEQLKSEGKIVDWVSGGKLIFRINH